jgi:hypothetical protein
LPATAMRATTRESQGWGQRSRALRMNQWLQ